MKRPNIESLERRLTNFDRDGKLRYLIRYTRYLEERLDALDKGNTGTDCPKANASIDA